MFKFEEKVKGSASHSALRYSPRFEIGGGLDDNYFDLKGEDLSPPKRKTTQKELMRDSQQFLRDLEKLKISPGKRLGRGEMLNQDSLCLFGSCEETLV